MSNPETQAYLSGDKLIAGSVVGEQVNLGADTYYKGMLLEYQAAGTNSYSGTGNGTITAIIARSGVKSGAWTMTMTAALTADLKDPDGNVVAQDIKWADDAAVTIEVAGIKMTLTDGATAFVAAGVHTITISAAGTYVAKDEGHLDAIYNGPTRTLATAGYGTVLTGGEIYEGGLVDDSGDALTVTNALRAALRQTGFAPRKVG